MITDARYHELLSLRGLDGRVPYRYPQVVDHLGTVAPYHEDGLSEAEHAEVCGLLQLLPAHMTYDDALRYTSDRDAMALDLAAWRAIESGRLPVVTE